MVDNMKMIAFLLLTVLIFGCISSPGSKMSNGSENFQRCISQCGSGAGSGEFCKDGCKIQEAEDQKNSDYCEQLYDKAVRPSCYGTVAKASGNIKVCDKLYNETEHKYCIAVFGSPGTG